MTRWRSSDAQVRDRAESVSVRDGSEGIDTLERLRADLGRHDLAKHVASFYRSPQTQLSTASAFVRHGLETGHRCLYFFDTNTQSTVERAFRSVGIDVAERTAAGDLLFRDGCDAYREADFDPERLIELLVEACRTSRDEDYEGLFVAGELSWAFHAGLSYDHVIDFEADFDAVVPDLSVTALCQYDLDRFDADSVAKALWTHEQVVYRHTVCENPYYVPPEEFRGADDRPPNVELPLEQMYSLARARRQVERREQRLTVLSRILRHNIRNDLNVVRGVLERIGDDERASGTDGAQVAMAVDHVDDLVAIAEKARHVERTIGGSDVHRTALAPVVARAVEQFEDTHPEAEVAVDGDADVPVVVDTTFDTALVEVLSYAVDRQDEQPPRVTLRVRDRAPESVRLDVCYPGEPVPVTERNVLERGIETELDHCEGLGL